MFDLRWYQRGTFFYYLGLIVGAAFCGAFYGVILMASLPLTLFNYMMLGSSGVVLLGSLLFAHLHGRKPRLFLTILTAIPAGVFGFLSVKLFPGLGLVYFGWLMFGILILSSVYSWTNE